MSHAIGRRPDLKAHHGTLNAILLPTVLRFNAAACTEKYARIRLAMGLDLGADIAVAVEQRNAVLGLPRGLSALGVTADMIPDLVPYAQKDLANFGNPRKVSAQEYAELFASAL
jgi:alcohol dehydrogenase class IV